MYTHNGNPVPGLGSVPIPRGPVAGGHFAGPSDLGQDVPDVATPSQESYIRLTDEPTELVPVASAADAQNLIEELQMRLKQRGFDPGTIDGLWGPKTAGALDAGRLKATIPKATNRVLVIESVIGVNRTTATRINDAINYQITVKAERQKAAAAAAAAAGAGQPAVMLPDGSYLPTTAAAIPLHKKWWFWGLIAAGIVGAGAITYVVIKKTREEDEFYPGDEVDESFVEAADEDF
jgi:peptidoglycan hydrolase-like protein with peptidoglycan-binding domain